MHMSRNSIRILIFSAVLFTVLHSPVNGQQKLAQTGMKFLNVGSDARVTAMAEAFTAVEGYSSSMFYNPAGMARQRVFGNILLGQTKWIGEINHNFASAAIVPFGGAAGVIGVSLQFVDYGELYATIRANNEEGFLDIGTFSPSASMIGVGYAIELSPRFSVGGNVKYVSQNLGSTVIGYEQSGEYRRTKSETGVLAFDLGVLYRTGVKSLNFGMTVRNFSREARYENEGFQLPLIFKIGISINALDLLAVDEKEHSLLVGFDATHPRDYPEQLNLGVEYVFMDFFAVRAGYMMNNDVFGLTSGLGVRRELGPMLVAVDYSYTPFDVFKDVHRLSFGFSF